MESYQQNAETWNDIHNALMKLNDSGEMSYDKYKNKTSPRPNNVPSSLQLIPCGPSTLVLAAPRQVVAMASLS